MFRYNKPVPISTVSTNRICNSVTTFGPMELLLGKTKLLEKPDMFCVKQMRMLTFVQRVPVSLSTNRMSDKQYSVIKRRIVRFETSTMLADKNVDRKSRVLIQQAPKLLRWTLHGYPMMD